jgi:type IV pilus assembly protein PilN
VGGLWLFLQQQNASLAQQKAELDSQLQAQQAERQKITTLNKQTEQVRTETTALATVFNQVKPWSAMLQDIRERIPPGVQIRNIEQVEVAPPTTPTPAASPSPSPAASPGANAAAASTARPTVNLKISGTARSFDDVNFFLLTLQRSSFFKGDETQLLNAQLVANPTKLEVPQTQNQSAAPVNQVKYELPKVVEYTIQTSLSDVPASELLRELDRKGAVGLVTRIRTLQEITKE